MRDLGENMQEIRNFVEKCEGRLRCLAYFLGKSAIFMTLSYGFRFEVRL
jgi:hypothetical protein